MSGSATAQARADWLGQLALEQPERIYIRRTGGASQSIGAFSDAVSHLATSLGTHCRSGDRIGWLGADVECGIALMFAAARLGVVFVPLNTRLTPAEITPLVAGAELTLLVPDAALMDKAQSSGRDTLVASVDDLQIGPELHIATPRTLPEWPYDTIQSVVFTSGTTGSPKGAQLTFGNQYSSAMASAERLGALPDDVWLQTLPLYHVGGMTVPFRTLLTGGSLLIDQPPGGFDAARLMALLEREPITHISLVPTMLQRLLDMGFRGSGRLRVILLGGAAAPPSLVERALSAGLPVAPTYGLTEACSQVATLTPTRVAHKPASVGQPLPGTHVAIRLADGRAAEPGEAGEIVVSGPTVFAGYIGDTRSLTGASRYYRTGDLGYLDSDGDLTVLARRTDLIVTGGENVYPVEVETVLREHPNIVDACVVGLPDDTWGQMVAAAIVVRLDAPVDMDALGAWCRQRLAGFKVPRLMQFVAELPLNATGKVNRAAVLNLLAASTGSPSPSTTQQGGQSAGP